MIVTANHYFGLTPPLHIKTWGDWELRVIAPGMARRGVAPQRDIAVGNILEAEVRQGAWMILCPGPGCKGAELAWEEGLFMCLSCFNNHVAHKLLPARLPEQRRAIEEILEPRPLLNRNWLRGESPEQLIAENMEHGLPKNMAIIGSLWGKATFPVPDSSIHQPEQAEVR